MKKKMYILLLAPFFTWFLILPVQLFAQPGALDPSFGAFGVAVTTEQLTQYQRILPLSSGRFLVTSSETASVTYPNGFTESATYSVFWRYNADGTRDLTYGTNGKRRFISSDLDHQFFTSFGRLSDGSIVALETYGYNGNYTPQNRVWKFNSDGTGRALIAELSVAGFHSTHLQGIAVDDANRIVVTGWVKRTGAGNQTYIARLLSDGSLDESFNNVGFRIIVENLSFNYSGEEVTTDRSNNIIVVEDGYYSAGLGFVNGHFMLKYLEDGSARTFTNVKLDGQIKSLKTDNNSKIIAHAGATIKRYNTNGTLDKTVSSTAHSVRRVIVQPDSKIVAFGSLSMNGHNVFNVIRYGTDGNLDQAFGSSGSVTTDLNFESVAQDVMYRNRRLYVSGHIVVPIANVGVPFGTIAAYDASDVRMTCPTPANPYSVNAGQCSATINNINAVMSSTTLWANVQNTVVHNGITTTGEGGVAGRQFQLGRTDITYSYTDITTQTCTFSVTVYDGDPPVARCKNITVPLDAMGNVTITAAQVNNGSTDGCGIQTMTVSPSTFSCSNVGTNTVTFTVTDVNGNSASCTAIVTIQDQTPPTVRYKNIIVELSQAGTTSITAADVNDGSSDLCGDVILAIDRSTFTCVDKGNNSVVLTVTDPNGNSASGTATVNVVDKLPPIITSVVATPSSLWPADRKMRNVTVAVTSSDNCPGTTCKITGVLIKAVAFAGDNIEPDWEITGDNTVNLRAEIPKKGTKRIYTIIVTCTDAAGNLNTDVKDVVVAPEKTTSATNTDMAEVIEAVDGLKLTAYPNPTNTNFSIQVRSSDVKEKITMQVFDVNGRLMLVKNLQAGSVIRLGDLYRPGVYYLRVLQGKQHKEMKLVKVAQW